jgi:hypothetical protein
LEHRGEGHTSAWRQIRAQKTYQTKVQLGILKTRASWEVARHPSSTRKKKESKKNEGYGNREGGTQPCLEWRGHGILNRYDY